jgi:LacI family transcriptional regulator
MVTSPNISSTSIISTIRDVAEKAGVSTTTVSHVINKTRFVSEDLVKRVTEAIEALNYQPSGLARSLRTKASGTLGVIIPDNTNPFFAEVVRGIEDYCYKQGYSVFLCNSDGDPDKEYHYIKLLREKGVDGMVLVSTGNDRDSLELLENGKIPKVIIDREVESINTDSVLIDNLCGGYKATKHLLDLGHTRIGCITGPNQLTPSGQRLEGYNKALKEKRITFESELIETGDFKSQSGGECLIRLMQKDKPPTAIFACNDIMAIGALAAARQLGIDVPNRLSLVGFDDIAMASMVVPSLTTIAQPKRELGETGATLLLERIKRGAQEQSTIILEPTLIERDSSVPLSKQ